MKEREKPTHPARNASSDDVGRLPSREEVEAEWAEDARKDALLTVAQRRAALDARGLHHVSAAPPPIKPVSTEGTPRIRPLPLGAPVWQEWLGAECELWEAVALTLNMNPHDLARGIKRELGQRGISPFLICPKPFQHRLSVASRHAGHGFGVSVTGNQRAFSLVRLSAFAKWAAGVWADLPDQLRQLSEVASAPSSASVGDKVTEAEEVSEVAPVESAAMFTPQASPADLSAKPPKNLDRIGLLIVEAQRGLADKFDAEAVMARLVEWAKQDPPKPPLCCVGGGSGVVWEDSNQQTQELTFKHLKKRLGRRQKANAK